MIEETEVRVPQRQASLCIYGSISAVQCSAVYGYSNNATWPVFLSDVLLKTISIVAKIERNKELVEDVNLAG